MKPKTIASLAIVCASVLAVSRASAEVIPASSITASPTSSTGVTVKTSAQKPKSNSTNPSDRDPGSTSAGSNKHGGSGPNPLAAEVRDPSGKANGVKTAPGVTSGKTESTPSRSSASVTKAAKSSRASSGKLGNRASNGDHASESRKNQKDAASLDSTLSDPELTALDRAGKAMFPWALRGIRSGFSFDDGPLSVGLPTSGVPAPAASWIKDLNLPTLFPNVDARILTYLEFFRSSPEGKSILRVWAKKRGRYTAAISATLAKSGVPSELVWQSLVESGHNPTIRSPAGAAGLWQFMPETARNYGLVVDRWIDERLDPERSTMAAARLMSDLYQRFGNWELALAAYNMGEAGLLRSIRKYNTNDFWTLSRYEAGLPMETALYVPRIIALSIVMQNPRAFAIDDIAMDDPIDFDSVVLAPGQSLGPVARIIGIAEDELGRYNPHLLAQRTPPSLATDKPLGRVFVPKGMAERVLSRVGRLLGLEPDLTIYSVKGGETLDWIANARGIALDTLRNINHAAADERFESGTILLVPRQSGDSGDAKASDEDRIAVVPPNADVPANRRRIYYRVRGGDSLTSIADAFGVSRSELLAYNSIDPSARLQPRMLLQVQVAKDGSFPGRSFLEEKDVTQLIAGSPEFVEYFEGQRGNERIVVLAKDKDTLATIGARYGVSVGMMERINRRSRRDPLIPGESVVVYARRKGGRERVSDSR